MNMCANCMAGEPWTGATSLCSSNRGGNVDTELSDMQKCKDTLEI